MAPHDGVRRLARDTASNTACCASVPHSSRAPTSDHPRIEGDHSVHKGLKRGGRGGEYPATSLYMTTDHVTKNPTTVQKLVNQACRYATNLVVSSRAGVRGSSTSW